MATSTMHSRPLWQKQTRRKDIQSTRSIRFVWKDKIFNIGIGAYSHDMLDAWLYANDLKHVFHAEPGGVIRW